MQRVPALRRSALGALRASQSREAQALCQLCASARPVQAAAAGSVPPSVPQRRSYALSRFPNDGPRFARRAAGAGGGGRHRLPRQDGEAERQHGEQEPKQAPSSAERDRALIPSELDAPVNVPHDAEGVLSVESDPHLMDVLGQSALIVTREIEMMNIFLGFEQANRYALLSPTGQPVGYLAEEEPGILGGSIRRQLLRTHRPFTATLLSTTGQPLLLFKRGFTLINSTVQVFRLDPSWDGAGYGKRAGQDGQGMQLIGESQQVFHVWRRKYDLFVNRPEPSAPDTPSFNQFARVDSGVLAWDFVMQEQDDKLIGAINRNFRGFGRELFTDTGQYVLRFDSIAQDELLVPRISPAVEPGQPLPDNREGRDLVPSDQKTRALTLDERAVSLATAVSIDFDYFSRHSHSGNGGMFPFLWMGSTSPSESQTGGESAPQSGQGQDSRGVMETPGAPGQDAGGLGGAGAIGAGYGMMGGSGGQSGQAPPPDPGAGAPPPPQDAGAFGQEPPPFSNDGWAQGPQEGIGGEQVWGSEEPWSESPIGGGDGGGGGGFIQGLWDMFGGGGD